MADYDDRTTGVMAVIRAARPSFRNKHDKVAFAVHATFLNFGYYLTAAGPPACKDGALTDTEEEVGVDGWNEMEGEYGFVYATDAKGFKKKVQVKCHARGNKLTVEALALEGGASSEIEMDVDDFAVEDSRPRGRGNNINYSDHYKNLEELLLKILFNFHPAPPARLEGDVFLSNESIELEIKVLD